MEKMIIFAPMKHRVAIGWVLLLALAACHSAHDDAVETWRATSLQPVASPELSAIDSLMWQRPDSALACLLPWFDTCRDAMLASPPDETFNNHYAHLLLAELLYKNDYAQTNRTELLQAVGYFDSLLVAADTRGVSLRQHHRHPFRRHCGRDPQSPMRNGYIPFLSARAHYINGVGYYERDSVVEACKEYLAALEIMENRFSEKDLVGEKARFIALTHTHLSGLYSDLYLHDQAICFGKRALEYYQRYDATPWHIAWILNEIGSHYDMMDNYDDADYYYHQSLLVLPDTNCLMYRDIGAHLIILSYKKGGSSMSTLNRLHDLLSRAESEKEYLSRCLTIGEYFYQEHISDSVILYLGMVYKGMNGIDSKLFTAKRLQEINLIIGDTITANEYAMFCSQFANPRDHYGTLDSKLTVLCDEYMKGKQKALHQSKLRETVRKSGLIILGLVTAFLVGFAVYFIMNKRRQEAAQRTHRMEQAALSGRLKRSNQELRELKDKIQLQENIRQKSEASAASFTEEPICRLIMERVDEGQFKSKVDYACYKDYALDKQQLSALRMAADCHFGQFTIRLKKAYPALTNSDLDYCCLYLLGLTDADIAALMQRAYNTVIERNGKLRKIFGSDNALFATLNAMVSQSPSV